VIKILFIALVVCIIAKAFEEDNTDEHPQGFC